MAWMHDFFKTKISELAYFFLKKTGDLEAKRLINQDNKVLP